MTAIGYRRVAVTASKYSIAKLVRPTLRHCFCCMAFPAPATCSAI